MMMMAVVVRAADDVDCYYDNDSNDNNVDDEWMKCTKILNGLRDYNY